MLRKLEAGWTCHLEQKSSNCSNILINSLSIDKASNSVEIIYNCRCLESDPTPKPDHLAVRLWVCLLSWAVLKPVSGNILG